MEAKRGLSSTGFPFTVKDLVSRSRATLTIRYALCCASAGFALSFLFGLGALQVAALATDKNSDRYPEKGKVVAVQASETTDYVPVSPVDSKGRSHGGEDQCGFEI